VDPKVGFGLQDILPLICNGSDPKVECRFIPKHIQGIKAGAWSDVQNARCCHDANL
jgi:hypothetical protein